LHEVVQTAERLGFSSWLIPTRVVNGLLEVTDELLASWRLGIDECILSGFPHLEACLRVHQEIVPRLRAGVAAAPVE
jgi:hypothetical protein